MNAQMILLSTVQKIVSKYGVCNPDVSKWIAKWLFARNSHTSVGCQTSAVQPFGICQNLLSRFSCLQYRPEVCHCLFKNHCSCVADKNQSPCRQDMIKNMIHIPKFSLQLCLQFDVQIHIQES